MQEEKLKLEDLLGRKLDDDGEQINNVAIIGAGVMGQGIAHTIAASGMDVKVIEKDQNKLDLAKSTLIESIDREIKRWVMTNSEKKSILSRIEWEIDH